MLLVVDSSNYINESKIILLKKVNQGRRMNHERKNRSHERDEYPPHKELRKLFNHIRWILTQK